MRTFAIWFFAILASMIVGGMIGSQLVEGGMIEGIASTLDQNVIMWFSIGLGIAFVMTMIWIMVFMVRSQIDHGFLGLILLLSLIFFLIAFSFLVAASAKGIDIKIAIVVVDAFVLFGSKLLAPRFLEYLE